MGDGARIFVSHAPEDTAWCRAFVQALREAGADMWCDEHHLGDGVSGEELERELQARPLFIAILSPASLASPRVQREVRAASGVRDTAWPTTRTILLVLAEQADVPRLWADYPRVSGPGDRGLSAPEAARRAKSTLASAPAHTPGVSAVSASSDPARAGKDYRPGPRAPNRDTWWPLASAVLVVVPACILALLYLSPLSPLSPPRPQICESLPLFDPIASGAPEGITAGPDGALWFTESQSNRDGRITNSG